MKVAICEDELAIREYESGLVYQWAQKNNLKVNVDLYTSGENFLFESEDKLEYDFLILDIQMGKINGVDLAKTLRKRGFSGSLVFMTGVRDYAIEGYEVGAVRYILKPVKESDFFDVMDLVYSDYNKKIKNVFLLQSGSDVQKIPFEDIIYVEARGHYVHITGTKEDKEWKCTFSKISDDFENNGFFCLRRGLLVNLQHVLKITRTECILDNQESLPVARNNYQELNEAFIKYYKSLG